MTRKLIFVYCILIISVFTTGAFCANPLASAGSSQGPDIFVQKGHSSHVSTIDFSPDGKYLVSGSSDKNIKLWEVGTGREMRTFVASDMVDFVAFSPDGKSLLSLESKGSVKLWDVKIAKEIRTLRKGGKPLIAVAAAFSPDGATLAVVGAPVEKSGKDLTFRNIQLLDIKTGREMMIFKGHTSSVHTIAFSPDGKYLASGSETLKTEKTKQDNTVRLWDVKTGKETHRFAGHTEGVSKVVFSPDGRHVASIGEDRNIFFWDINTGKMAKSLRGFPVSDLKTRGAIAFSPDGRYFVAASAFPPVMTLWDIATGQVEASMTDDRKIDDAAVSYSPDGRLIAVPAGDKVSLWDAVSHRKIRTFGGDVKGINLSFFSADQERIKIAGNVELTVFDRHQGRFIGRQTIETFDNWSTNGQNEWGNRRFLKIIDKGYQVIDSKTDRAIISDATDQYPTAYDSPQQAVTFSPDGRFALMAEKDGGKVNLLNVRNRRVTLLANFPDHVSLSSSAGYVAFSPDGSLVAAASYSLDDERGVLGLWDTATGKQSVKLRANKKREGFNHVAFTADGKQIVTSRGGNQGVIGLWDLASGKEIRSFSGHSSFITSLALSGDGKYIVSGDWIGAIKLWNLHKGGEIKTLKGHTDEIKSLAFSVDGNHVLSASKDGATRLWSISTGKEIAQFVHFEDGEWIVITPEGYFNASPGGAKHLNVRVGNQVYGIDQFYTKFYRPELVQLALSGKELPKGALITDIAAQKPAPKVQILSPVAGSSVDQDSVAVTLKITDSGGGIGSVNIYLNGAQVANDTRGVIVKEKVAANEKVLSFTIALIKGQNEIRVVAFNGENSMESNPARISVISRAVMRKPNLYALVIGINTYRNQSISLTFAVPDAVAFAAMLQKVASPLFEKVDVRTLTTPEATTKEAITRAFEDVRQKVGPNDLFIFYNASHGMVDVVNGEEQYFLLTSNVRLLSSQHISKDALSHKDLVSLIGSIPAQKKLVILDTCNAGKGGKEIQIALLQQTRGLTDATAVKLLQRAVGSSVFSASSDTQQALEGYKGHGLFTYVLLEGLQGAADFKKDGFITVKGLALHTEERVMTLSEDIFKRQQNPMIETGVNDFPIGRVR